MSYFNIVHLF